MNTLTDLNFYTTDKNRSTTEKNTFIKIPQQALRQTIAATQAYLQCLRFSSLIRKEDYYTMLVEVCHIACSKPSSTLCASCLVALHTLRSLLKNVFTRLLTSYRSAAHVACASGRMRLKGFERGKAVNKKSSCVFNDS
jgi:hypothetical protein